MRLRTLSAVLLLSTAALSGCRTHGPVPAPPPPPPPPPPVIAPAPTAPVELPAVDMTAAPIPPALVEIFPGGQHFMLARPLVYRILDSADSIVVPAGFVTDLASIPGPFLPLFTRNGPYQLPGIIHDYLYWVQSCTREEADRILRIAMRENGVPAPQQRRIYFAVDQGGRPAWNANARDRANGRPKIVPPEYRDLPAGAHWPRYQQDLMDLGVRPGAEIPVSPAACAHGRG